MATVEAFRKAPLCSEVHGVLVSHLLQVFGDEYDKLPLAVRSSASGIMFTKTHLAAIFASQSFKLFCRVITTPKLIILTAFLLLVTTHESLYLEFFYHSAFREGLRLSSSFPLLSYVARWPA